MANFLAQFQTIKNSCDHLVIAVEVVSDLWPTFKIGFEEGLPFRKDSLNNKTRNPVFLEKLPAEFILTADSRLCSRFPQEPLLFWFQEPYATVVLVTCELSQITIMQPNWQRKYMLNLKSSLAPRREKALHASLELLQFFVLKESLAFMFEMAHLHEDALREYDELELCFLETVNTSGKQRDFAGVDQGDILEALLNPGNKPLTQIGQDDSFREFEFRQYLFACQSKDLSCAFHKPFPHNNPCDRQMQ
ncbi:trafficking protein particle complex II-specific subunit 130-like [Quillaja saponaria]|uniref:Trafficking protein particle complex II-specific subunit 130-like n=1 Tax=Quillaja saponaria TaxID=32244 RepID=A0AAD7KZ40_QUISA|nr:trafficking protein particle complex II-specific subunit 130-like [Quillaja saponaria]